MLPLPLTGEGWGEGLEVATASSGAARHLPPLTGEGDDDLASLVDINVREATVHADDAFGVVVDLLVEERDAGRRQQVYGRHGIVDAMLKLEPYLFALGRIGLDRRRFQKPVNFRVGIMRSVGEGQTNLEILRNCPGTPDF